MKFLLTVLCLVSSAFAGATQPTLVRDASIAWRDSDPRFGGLSAFSLVDGGAGIVAIGDRGIWATGQLTRKDGRLTGVTTTGIGALHGVSGRPLKKREVDAEGLTFDAQGRAYVSFEGLHRIRRYDDLDGPATGVPGYVGFEKLWDNLGLEALTMDASGVLYAIPERPRNGEPWVPVFRYRDGKWDQDLSLPRRDRFAEVDADFGPDGYFYLLERRFKWMGGFATQLRRFRLGPNGFEDETILLSTGFGEIDNMEGISVWRDDRGQIRVTLISDDNFFALQRTVIAEYILKEN